MDRTAAVLGRPGMKLRNRRAGDGVISQVDDNTVMDSGGAVRSIQSADLTMPAGDRRDLVADVPRAPRAHLLAVPLPLSLGLIRVEYTETERRVVLLRRPFVLLASAARVRDGATAASCAGGSARRARGQARPRIPGDRRAPQADDDRPGYENLHVEVEVANYYPRIATAFTQWAYKVTQSRIHVIVTYGFLRSIARRELDALAVGRFADRTSSPSSRRHAVGGRRRRRGCGRGDRRPRRARYP